jgi:undecaprenyl-diphosphatase
MDVRLFQLINGLAARNAVMDRIMFWCAKGLPFIYALVLVALWLTWKRKYQIAAFLSAISAFVALGIGQVLIRLFPRLRPYDLYPTHLLVDRTQDPSFPSDHATLAFAVATLVWQVNRKLGFVLFLLAVLQGFARIYVGAHYPTDVAGGAVLGTVTSIIVWKVSRLDRGHRLLESLFTCLARLRVAVNAEGTD